MDIFETYLNIPRLYTAIAEWLSVIIFIGFIPKRYPKKYTLLISILFLFILVAFHLWASTWRINYWVLGMILVVLIMYFFISLTYKVNKFVSGHLTVFAFILSEFMASLEWQLEYYFITNANLNLTFINKLSVNLFDKYNLRISLLLIIVYLMVFLIAFYIEKRYQNRNNKNYFNKGDLPSILVIGVLIFVISNFSFLNINSPITSNNPLEIFYIRTLVDLVGVIILYSQREHTLVSIKNLEVSLMNNLLDRQYEQYKSTMRSIDIINQKYHDLKHHINVIRFETDESAKQKYFDKLEEKIKPYEAIYQTGNKVLDIILNSKGEQIIKGKINFTCIADGELLNFITSIDLVSIFSNALDNAIENLINVEEEKRLLKLSLYSQANLVMIKIENYYENKLRYYNGQLLTTKGNQEYHGFGLKSIKSSVEKYNGSLTINTENNWFTILILIPSVK